MIRGWRATSTAVLAAAAAFVGAVVVGAATPVPSAADQTTAAAVGTDEQPVRVSLKRLNPAIVTDEDRIVVAGRIANASLSDVSDAVVRLRLSPGPLQGRQQIARIDNGDWDGYAIQGADFYLGDVLPVGAQRDFRIEVPKYSLPLDSPGAYVLSAEVVGSNGLEYTRLGITRTLLPYVPLGAEPVRSRVVWLWPLSAAPARDANGVLLGNAVPDEISPGGRLRTILDAGTDFAREVSWIVDAELLQTVSAMERGYLVDIDGTVEPGTRSTQARTWLTDLRRLGAAAQVRVLPYADVDVEGLVRAGLTTDVVRAAASAPPLAETILQRRTDGPIAWAPGGSYDAASIEALAATGVRAVVLRDVALPPDDGSITPTGSVDIPTASGVVRGVLTDSGLRAALSAPQQGAPQVLLARQQFLAELTVMAFEAPTIPRTVVAATSGPRWNPSAALLRDLLRIVRDTPWLESTPLRTLIDEPPSRIPRTAAERPQDRTLPEYYIERIAALNTRVNRVATVLSQPAAFTEPLTATLLRAESSAWRFRIYEGEQVVGSVERAVRDIEEGVSVVSGDDVILSGDTGSVPITVANDLDQVVTVGVRLVGDPRPRLESDALTAVEIEPGKRESLVIPVRVIGGDPLRVRVEILDGEGGVLTTGGAVELRTTAYARAARWFTVGAAILLGLMVVFDIWRRVRRRGRPAAA